MKIYSGVLGLVGDGTVKHNNMGPSRTTRSVIEIGDHTLRSVRTDNFIESYLRVGEKMDILVTNFLWMKAIVGIRMNGKSYKVRKADVYLDIYLMVVVLGLFYALLISIIGFFGNIIGIGCIILYIRIKARALKQFHQF